MEWGYPPGSKLTDYVADDMKPFIHPHWSNFPPINPMMRYFLATCYCVLFILGNVGNYVVMYMFSKKKELKSPANNYIVNLALSDMCMLWSQYPMYVYNVFNGGTWQFGPLACQMYAAAGSIFGICSICTICAMCIERYDVIVRGCSENRLTYGRSFAVIFACWGYAIFWSIGPFFGFGKYIPEGTLESCAFDFLTRDKETIGFSLGLLVTNYCMPLTIMTYCNFHIVMAIIRHNSMLREQATKMNVTSLRCSSELIAMSSEVRYAKIVMVNLSLWVWAWTPYVGIVMQAVFGDQMQVTPVLTIIPSLFAKCSAITNPIVLAYGHTRYRLVLKKYMHRFCTFFINEEEPNKDNPIGTVSSVEST